MFKCLKRPCKSHLYLTQSNLSVSNFDILGTKDTNAALVMLLDSIKETPDQNHLRQCRKGIYLYRMRYTMFSVNKIDELLKACCEPSSFNYVSYDHRVGTFVKLENINLSKTNWIMVTLRTRSGNGPTLEINLSFPKQDKIGEIIKIRILGKLIII